MNRLITMVVAGLLVLSAAPAGAHETVTVRKSLSFVRPNGVFRFKVRGATPGPSILRVDVKDAGTAGDAWGVRIIRAGTLVADTCGDGSRSFSGLATATGFRRGAVEIFYCSGNDGFPAKMTARFRYAGSGLRVTQADLPGPGY